MGQRAGDRETAAHVNAVIKCQTAAGGTDGLFENWLTELEIPRQKAGPAKPDLVLYLDMPAGHGDDAAAEAAAPC